MKTNNKFKLLFWIFTPITIITTIGLVISLKINKKIISPTNKKIISPTNSMIYDFNQKYGDLNKSIKNIINKESQTQNRPWPFNFEDYYWFKNPKWTNIFLQHPGKVEKLLKQFPYLTSDVYFKNFFWNIYASNWYFNKNVYELNFGNDMFVTKVDANLITNKLRDNFFVLQNIDEYNSIFEDKNLKFFQLNGAVYNSKIDANKFKTNDLIVYIKEGDGFWESIFANRTTVDQSLWPFNIVEKNGAIVFYSFNKDFNNYFEWNINPIPHQVPFSYENIQELKNEKKIPKVPNFPEAYQSNKQEIFLVAKWVPKLNTKTPKIEQIHFKNSDDLILNNALFSTNRYDDFTNFISKKNKIQSLLNQNYTHLYIDSGYENINPSLFEDKIIKNYEDAKQIVDSTAGNIWWAQAFHIANLFTPDSNFLANDKVEFNDFVLYTQHNEQIYNDEFLYWKLDEKNNKVIIYTYNYRDLFSGDLANSPLYRDIDRLYIYVKINLQPSIKANNFEFKKIKTLDEFEKIYQEITNS
ncbi:hypothetical protein [Mesomycoplasma conjunctivae]|uniref:hypothetical protein n=1 Tax=Mesomycoplasma conjunctivae TaxID=45361 RepID=UPI003DA47A73